MVNFSIVLQHINKLQRVNKQPAILACISCAVSLIALYLVFNPCFETNDDIGMSMVVHGYGIAAYGVPQLIFSNVIWGYLIRLIPEINGIFGYSLATIAILFVIGWALLYFLLRLGINYFVSILVVTLLLLRPMLIPQFTINAGLLTLAAVLGWWVYARFKEDGSLYVASLLAFLSYLIRNQEFFLVLAIALPLFPWRELHKQWKLKMTVLLLVVVIALGATVDHWSYSGPEWQPFLKLNWTRALFTDFGAGEHLKQHLEIITRHHYSKNDINLIERWFFVDPRITNIKSLNDMLSELKPLPLQGNFQLGLMAIKMLGSPILMPLLLPALLLFLLAPRRSIALSWVLLLVATFTMGVMGRPGIIRVYIPMLSLLVVAPLKFESIRDGKQAQITLVFFIACIANTFLLMPEVIQRDKIVQEVRPYVQSLPRRSTVVWGATLPYPFIFPVLTKEQDSAFGNLRVAALGVFTLAPFSVAVTEAKTGNGIIKQLLSPSGIQFVASQGQITLLRNYCYEHFNGRLETMSVYKTPFFIASQERCLLK